MADPMLHLGGDVRPLALRAEVELAANGAGTPKAVALINPTGEPWEIHEVKFSVRRKTDATLRQNSSGGIVLCRMTWMGKPVTQGLVPLWNFGLAKRLGFEIAVPFQYLPIQETPSVFQGARSCDAYYSWKLDHPLYIPPGGILQPEFQHAGMVPETYRVGVLYSGRVLKDQPLPKKVKVPFVSCWRSNFFEALLETGTDQSPPSQLVNEFDHDLTIERFIGRVCQTSSYTAAEVAGAVAGALVDDLEDGLFATELFRIRNHLDSVGNIIVRGYEGGSGPPLRAVYGPKGRAWQQRHVLPPTVGHRLFLQKLAAPAGVAYRVTALETIKEVRASANISMVGWREEYVP